MPTATEIALKERLEAVRAQRAAMLSARQAQATQNKDVQAPAQEQAGMSLLVFVPLLGLAALLDLLPLLDAGTLTLFISVPGDLLLLVVAGVSRGGKKQIKKLVAGAFGEAVPFVNVLPIRSIMLVVAYIQSNPKLAQQLGTVAKIAGKIPLPQTQAAARGFQVAAKTVQIAGAYQQGGFRGAAAAGAQFRRGFATTGTQTTPPSSVRRAA